jgi:anaerobic ribonucleoside-triphosphate reductase activating protein
MSYSQSASVLNLYMRESKTRALGPGLRYAIWVQGCPFRCPGCLVPDSHNSNIGEAITVTALANEILQHDDIEGLTLSGGEPFLQALPLANLIKLVRVQRDLGVIVYTGHKHHSILREIKRHPEEAWSQFYQEIDLLIDGLFVEALNDDGSLRGSSNQEVIPITSRYESHLTQYGSTKHSRRVEISIKDDELKMIGLPSQKLLESMKTTGYLSI